MKRQFFFITGISLALLMQGCKIMYNPNMQNIPLFKEKNEVRATVGFSDFQTAYSVSDHVGLMLNGQYKNPTWTITSGSAQYKYESRKLLVEGGGGYFKPLGKSGVFETYGGGGIGNLTFDRTYSDSASSPVLSSVYSAKTMRFFVQPGIGITTDYVDFAFSARLVGLKFHSVDSSGYSDAEMVNEQIYNLDKPLYTFIEPALTMRFGYKYVKFHLQAIVSLKMNSEPLSYIPFTMNFGAHINIAGRHKKK